MFLKINSYTISLQKNINPCFFFVLYRVVNEDDTIRIYYSVNNSREYHAEEPQYLEIDADLAPAVEALISHYPEYLAVEEFPIEDTAAKVQIASDLWEHGLLMTEEPLGYTSE